MPLLLISDSTGDLAERFVRAVISQFPKGAFGFRVFSFVTDNAELEKRLAAFEPGTAIVFHTVVSTALKKRIAAVTRRRRFPSYDLTVGAMSFLMRSTGLTPTPDQTAVHELNPEYDQRIAALNFTVEHDDGTGASTRRDADILLLGVSRTSKTPTSIYLANKGFKVANVPLVHGIPVPDDVRRDGHRRIVGLTINPAKLQDIRLRRAETEKIPGERYTDLGAIREEIRDAARVYAELGCPVIDVTNHAVEEVAALILKALGLR